MFFTAKTHKEITTRADERIDPYTKVSSSAFAAGAGSEFWIGACCTLCSNPDRRALMKFI
eukprot:scaffold7021_cov120-Skeletonema_dohrnii-CCMP3373.AAC.6